MLFFLRRATCGDDQALTICSPKPDGTYIVEFRTAAGESLAISVPGTEAALLKHFQARNPVDKISHAMKETVEVRSVGKQAPGFDKRALLKNAGYPGLAAEVEDVRPVCRGICLRPFDRGRGHGGKANDDG